MRVLEDTSSSEIAAAFVAGRREAGTQATGMVMTLVIVAPEDDLEAAVAAAQEAAREHPSRLIALSARRSRGESSITAEVRAACEVAGELAVIRLAGAVAEHADSVVLPLLLPDSPVVVWWPTDAPDDPAADPVGALANRRITDSAQASKGKGEALLRQCASYAPGNTDLAWTRITPWRALLAAAIDQVDAKVTEVGVTAERISPSADLLAAWLADRLRVPASRSSSKGPGITEVSLTTADGDIRIVRDDGRLGTLSVPGQPDRPVALRRRDVPELLTEELRRLDPDDIYAETVRKLEEMSA